MIHDSVIAHLNCILILKIKRLQIQGSWTGRETAVQSVSHVRPSGQPFQEQDNPLPKRVGL